MRYIAVIHGWHVSSKGFDIHQLEAKTPEDANKEAKVLTYDRNSTFDTCAYALVEIEDKEVWAKAPDPNKTKSKPSNIVYKVIVLSVLACAGCFTIALTNHLDSYVRGPILICLGWFGSAVYRFICQD